MQTNPLLLTAILASLTVHTLWANETALYDNVPETLPTFQGAAIGFDPMGRSAQPFTTGAYGTLSAVTVPIATGGSPTGLLHVEIWNDVNGEPGAKVATVGDIDVTTVPGYPTGIAVTIEQLITELVPNTIYYVVLNTDDVRINCGGPGCNTILIQTTNSNEDTNSSGKLLIADTPGEWYAFPDRNYQRLEIFECAPPAPLTAEIERAVAVSWNSQDNTIYRIYRSMDMENWEVAVEAITGTGERLTQFFHQEEPIGFYRVEEQ